MKATFHVRLKHARTELRKMTQKELEDRAGLPNGIVAQLENKHRSAGINSLMKLALALDVTSDYLLGLSDEPVTNYGEMDHLYTKLCKMPHREKAVIEQMLLGAMNAV